MEHTEIFDAGFSAGACWAGDNIESELLAALVQYREDCGTDFASIFEIGTLESSAYSLAEVIAFAILGDEHSNRDAAKDFWEEACGDDVEKPFFYSDE